MLFKLQKQNNLLKSIISVNIHKIHEETSISNKLDKLKKERTDVKTVLEKTNNFSTKELDLLLDSYYKNLKDTFIGYLEEQEIKDKRSEQEINIRMKNIL